MRLAVHGQQAFGKAVLDALIERGRDEIVGVFCAPPKDGKPEDPLAQAARAANLPLHQPKSWKSSEALELMQAVNADLCVMAYVTLLVPQPVLDAPTHGTIQYHPSLLPKHRGPSSINWPIAQGARETGLTIFWPDEGLDEGPVLLQKTVEIGPDETLGDVYFNKLFPLGVEAMLEAVDLVRAGNAPKIAQDHSEATYESWFTRKDAAIDWSAEARHIYNIIRAANPQPGAWTSLKGAEFSVYDSELAEGSGAPGEVLAIGETGILVAAKGGAILIKRVRPTGEAKISAYEFADRNGLQVGAALGS